MKKFFAFIFIISIVCFCSLSLQTTNYLFALSSNGKVEFYCSVDNAEICNNQIKNGDGYILSTTTQNAEDIYSKISGCFGFSVELENSDNNYNDIMKRTNIIKYDELESKNIIYGYMVGLPFSNVIENKNVNIQIVKMQNKIIVGCPLVLGSY